MAKQISRRTPNSVVAKPFTPACKSIRLRMLSRPCIGTKVILTFKELANPPNEKNLFDAEYSRKSWGATETIIPGFLRKTG